MKKKNIVILGSTGSIGQNCLQIVEKFPEQFNIIALSAGKNIELLRKQINKFRPDYVAIHNVQAYKELKSKVRNCEILLGEKGIYQLCKLKGIDLLVNAIIGSTGLKYTIEAIKNRKRIALANKESYVMAGDIINQLIKKYQVTILPIDSEHSALFYLLLNQKKENIEKIILTASGGPFLNKSLQDFKHITIENTLKHPVWSMGGKITVDSATLINKGFEIIEAHHLFQLPYYKIEVIIHPQSIIHSLIQTIDGEFYAQLSKPDMRYPILNAFSFPKMNKYPFEKLNFWLQKSLTFQKPDFKKFPLLKFAYEIGQKGGNLPAALCIADDIVVHRFLNKQIKFLEIYKSIRNIVKQIKYIENPDLEYIFWLEENMKSKFER